MDASNYAGAIQSFKGLESRYPFSPETRQAQLDLIYLYYKSRSPSRRSTRPSSSSARTPPIRASTTACT